MHKIVAVAAEAKAKAAVAVAAEVKVEAKAEAADVPETTLALVAEAVVATDAMTKKAAQTNLAKG